MRNVAKLLYTCEKNSAMTRTTIDHTLLPLAMEDGGIRSEFIARMRKDYKVFAEEARTDWPAVLSEQYIVAQLFGANQLAKDYLEHLQVRRLSSRERGFLREQLLHPWDFVFMEPLEDLGNDFFEMEDLLSGDTFLLYSPSVSKYETMGQMSMYFTLRGFNGQCYQTYGPITYFRGVQIFDVLFFARQLDSTVETYDELGAFMQRDPLPFMTLLMGSEYPVAVHEGSLFVLCQSEIQVPNLDLSAWGTAFDVQEKDGVYKLDLQGWNQPPHYASCYYDRVNRMLLATSLTSLAYNSLINTLAEFNVNLPETPDVLLTPAGRTLIQKILGKELATNPYAEMFDEDVSPEKQGEINAANRFLGMLVSAHNSGEEYDPRELAHEAEIPYEMAQEIATHIQKRLDRYQRPQ